MNREAYKPSVMLPQLSPDWTGRGKTKGILLTHSSAPSQARPCHPTLCRENPARWGKPAC